MKRLTNLEFAQRRVKAERKRMAFLSGEGEMTEQDMVELNRLLNGCHERRLYDDDEPERP